MKLKQVTNIVLLLIGIIIAVIPLTTFSGTNESLLLDKANSTGSIKVIVKLNVTYQTEGLSTTQAVIDQRFSISQAQSDVISHLSNHNVSNIKQFETIPYMALEIDAEGLDALLKDPKVISIEEDIPVPPTLNQSIPFINADDVHNLSYDGTGYAVAVLDTGVRKTHEFLDSGKVVSEACYSTTYAPHNATILCPNGSSSQIGSGAGVNCDTSLSGCSHGTHVAGIIAGTGGSSASTGVAPGADIIAIQVFSRVGSESVCGIGNSPCVLTYTSDNILGLERVYALRSTYNIASVNMSLGGGAYSGYCDDDPRKAIIDNLHAVGIATVVSSGNDGFDGYIGAPSCISTAITVGATWDNANTVSYYSNHASMVDIMAPGSSITSSVATSNTSYSSYDGTSMAAPHVAGAFAVMKSKNNAWTVSDIESLLKSTGVDVTRSSVTKPRVDLLAALGVVDDDDDAYEENDTRETAYSIINDEQKWLNTIDGYGIQKDEDWYAIYVNSGFENVKVDLRFTHADGDIDIALYDSSGTWLANSNGISDSEFIDYVVSQNGYYYLKVYYSNAGNSYNLWWDDLAETIVVPNTIPIAVINYLLQ